MLTAFIEMGRGPPRACTEHQHFLFAALNMAPWFAYVASKPNSSDGLSRTTGSIGKRVVREIVSSAVPATNVEDGTSSVGHDWVPIGDVPDDPARCESVNMPLLDHACRLKLPN